MKAAQRGTKDQGTVRIIAPAAATDLKWNKDEIEFKLDAGTAAGIMDLIHELMKDGSHGSTKSLDPTAAEGVDYNQGIRQERVDYLTSTRVWRRPK